MEGEPERFCGRQRARWSSDSKCVASLLKILVTALAELLFFLGLRSGGPLGPGAVGRERLWQTRKAKQRVVKSQVAWQG